MYVDEMVDFALVSLKGIFKEKWNYNTLHFICSA